MGVAGRQRAGRQPSANVVLAAAVSAIAAVLGEPGPGPPVLGERGPAAAVSTIVAVVGELGRQPPASVVPAAVSATAP